MESFKRKAEAIETLREQMNEHVIKIFNRYIKDFDTPNNPHLYTPNWTVDWDVIRFEWEDGCCGQYRTYNLSIPFEFFENYDEAFSPILKEKEEAKKAKALEKKLREAAQKESLIKFEREQYERLKAKYE